MPLPLRFIEGKHMETFEIIAMMAALGFMFAAVGAKIFTGQLLSRMKSQISQVAQVKQGALGRLKMAQSQKTVTEQNKAAFLTKKTKLAKKLNRLKSEMGKMREEEAVRRQRTEMRKVD